MVPKYQQWGSIKLSKLRKPLNWFARRLGLEVNSQLLPSPVYDVSRIVDVGVANGTPHLLTNYPDATFYFVEAHPGYHKFIQRELLTKFKGVLIPFGAGERLETLKLSDRKNASGFLPRTKAKKGLNTIDVQVAPLDDLLKEQSFFERQENTLLKIDTEGFEMVVLKGASKLLKDPFLKYIQIEMRFNFVENTYNPSELFSFLLCHGFRFERVDHIEYRRGDISYMDMTFSKISNDEHRKKTGKQG